ncbi:hypothetical protein Mmah_1057 [Methanohalophilus mahii DSM 5219]|uniref:Uncharacterized protein n=1 Tax=Methanohalophilus mahii (strain ATCC 35705 / DSM 5219 / SLP) TaxID=547558 RepID=D5EBL9_METMS|nr:hypothetical protein Mmah_1057 [Methanohalophilus mahii DSM 5219]
MTEDINTDGLAAHSGFLQEPFRLIVALTVSESD